MEHKKELLILYIAGAITAVAATSYFLYQQYRKGGNIDLSKFVKIEPGPVITGALTKVPKGAKPRARPPQKPPVKMDKKQIDVIRKTILKYVEKEMEHHLEERGYSEKKAREITDLVEDKIGHIIGTMDLSILIPPDKLETKEELEAHIMKIIESIKPKLMDELGKGRG